MKALILPVLVQVILNYVLLFTMSNFRVREGSKSREIRAAVRDGAPPPFGRTATLLSDNLKNQFEFPVLFYAAVAVAIAADQISVALIVTAWIFVISRIVHTSIHVTNNHIPRRMIVFAVSVLAALVMWLIVGFGILTQ